MAQVRTEVRTNSLIFAIVHQCLRMWIFACSARIGRTKESRAPNDLRPRDRALLHGDITGAYEKSFRP
jgi:hypothetical protein